MLYRTANRRTSPSLRSVALACALLVLTALPAGAAPRPQPQPLTSLVSRALAPGDPVPGSLLVTAADTAARDRLIASMDGAVAVSAETAHVRVPPGEEEAHAAELRERDGVVAVEPDTVRALAVAPNDPEYARQWAHAQTGIESAWDRVRARVGAVGSRAVRVAVIDSGMRGDHPDLRANVERQADASGERVREVGPGMNNDTCSIGHGTRVGGIIGAVGDNRQAVAGVNWQVSLIDIALTSSATGSCDPLAGVTDSVILRAFDYALRSGAHVVNLSLAAFQDACPTAYQRQLDAARSAGVVVVAAAGNGEQRAATRGLPAVPASCNGVVSVGATARAGTVAGYSSTNRWVDLVAPGGAATAAGGCDEVPDDCIATTGARGGTAFDQGTSFAAAYVTGLAALLLSVRPDLTPDQVESTLERTARDLGDGGRDHVSGWGLVQADAAVRLVTSASAIPRPAPDPEFPVSDDSAVRSPPGDPTVTRVSADTGTTSAVGQAVAVSQAVFQAGGARHVVLARDDHYADALAGSSLGFGVGPLLFTPSTGRLHPETRAELRRVLPAGGIVYLLGGSRALSAETEDEVANLGFKPVRLAGPTREDTAAAVALELRTRLQQLHATVPSVAILATRDDWPDAVSAGSLGAFFGVPIVLTSPDRLASPTARVLRELAPSHLYVVGGTQAVSDGVAEAARASSKAQQVTRLAGASRDATGVAVAREVESIFAAAGAQPRLAVAVNISRPDAFAHALSASTLVGAYSGLFVPVLGDDGGVLTDVVAEFVRGLGIDGVVAGDVDLIAEQTRDRLQALLAYE